MKDRLTAKSKQDGYYVAENKPNELDLRRLEEIVHKCGEYEDIEEQLGISIKEMFESAPSMMKALAEFLLDREGGYDHL